MRSRLPGLLALIPITLPALGAFALAWREGGSIVAADWLAYALGAALLVATVLGSGAGQRLSAGRLLGLGALAALAVWTALSAAWSPTPALARDEALLVLFYGLLLALPLLTLRSEGERLAAIGIVVAASVTLVLATSVRLVSRDDLADLYWYGRLASPIGYPGAEAAIFLISFWPAAVLAASGRLHVAARGLAFGGAVALLSGWLMTQSRAGTLSLAVSAVVVFALAPARLRLLVPVGCAAALAGASYGPLTEPFREQGANLEASIEDAGRWTLVLALAGTALGLVYALADRRLSLPPPFVRAAGAAALSIVALGAVAGLGGFLVTVDKPGAYVADRWEEFKREPERETGSSHLATIGSNRYDFWRVALNEFREHPLAGGGGRAFGAAYLRNGRTDETPKRAHSLELDVLSETGLAGLLIAVTAFLPFAWIIVRRALSDLVGAGVLGGAVYWLVQASGDWIWTFPAVGSLFFLLLGIGAAGDEAAERPSASVSTGQFRRTIAARAALPTGLVLAAVSLLVFAPPWLSSRYTARALEQSQTDAQDELRWARRLDPLTVDPLVAEAELAASATAAIPPLEDAVEREPRSMAARYLLGVAYLDAGRHAEARRELGAALRLAPRSNAARQALRRAEASG